MKNKLILLGLVFVLLLSLTVSATVPDNYILIEADSVTDSYFNVNGCSIQNVGTSKYLFNCSGTEEVQRALMYKTLFFGTDGTNEAITHVTGLSNIYTTFARDVGKTATYIDSEMNKGSDGDPDNTYLTGTFSDTTTNTDVSSWSKLYAKSVDSVNSQGRSSWYINSATLRHDNNQLNTNDVITSDELGTDLSADETDNPANFKINYIQQDNSDGASSDVLILHTGTISYVKTDTNGDLYYTETNYYVDENVPYFEALPYNPFFINVLDSQSVETISEFDITVTDGTYTQSGSSNSNLYLSDFSNDTFINRDLVSSWNLDKNDNVTIEDQVSSNDGTLYGKTLNDGTITGATYDTHTGDMVKFGDYLEFDGDNDYIQATLSTLSNYTVTQCGWINILDNSTLGGILGFPSEQNQLLINGDGRFRFSNNNNGRRDFSIYGVTNKNINQYICINTNDRKIYRYNSNTNIMDDITGINTGVGTGTPVGTYIVGSFTSSSLPFNGSVDEVKQWSEDLTITQMSEEATSVGVANPEGIVAYYNFDEGSGTTAYDKNYVSTGLNENVTSYNFDGVDDYITTPKSTYIDVDKNFSISVWAYTKATGTDNQFIVGQIDGTNGRFGITKASTGTSVRVGYYDGSSYHSASGNVNINSYNHIYVYHDGTTHSNTLYTNGVLQSGTTNPASSGTSATAFTYIGSRTLGLTSYEGSIALPKIYDRALNETEILDLYTRELADERYPFQQSQVNISITNAIGEELRPYFDNETSNVAVTSQYNITVDPYTKITAEDTYNSTKLYDFDVEWQSSDYNADSNGNVFLPFLSSGLVTLSNTNYFDNQTTVPVFASYNTLMTPYTAIYATSYPSEDTIYNFTVEYTNQNDVDDNDIISTTNGVIYLPLYNSSYTVEIRPQSYEYKSTTLTGSPYLQNYTFTGLQEGKSILANFVDITTQLGINNVDFELISDSYANNYTTTNGTLFIEDLVADKYVARFRSSGYIENFYIFTIADNYAEDLTLYMNPDNNDTIVKEIQVIDLTGKPVSGATVKSLRYDLTTNQYQILTITDTNADGYTYHYLTFNDEFFKYVVEYQNETKLITDPEIIYSSDTTTLQIDTGTKTLATFYNDFINLDYSLEFNNNTNNVVFTYNQLYTIGTEGCLVLYDVTYGNREQINNTCASTSANTLSLHVSDLNKSYEAQAIYLYDGEYYFIDILNIDPNIDAESFGTNLFIFQIIITLIILGIASIGGAEMILITLPLSLIIGRMLNFNFFTYTSLFIIQVVFMIIAYLVYKER